MLLLNRRLSQLSQEVCQLATLNLWLLSANLPLNQECLSALS